MKLFLLCKCRNTSLEDNIIGLAKVACKQLWFIAEKPTVKSMYDKFNTLSLLDFYVRPQEQRKGYGLKILTCVFDCLTKWVVQDSDGEFSRFEACDMAYELPSPLLYAFLSKHFNLTEPVMQPNTFVIYHGFRAGQAKLNPSGFITVSSEPMKLAPTKPEKVYVRPPLNAHNKAHVETRNKLPVRPSIKSTMKESLIPNIKESVKPRVNMTAKASMKESAKVSLESPIITPVKSHLEYKPPSRTIAKPAEEYGQTNCVLEQIKTPPGRQSFRRNHTALLRQPSAKRGADSFFNLFGIAKS